MASRKVSLWKYASIPGKGWRYVRAAFHANGKVKAHVCIVGTGRNAQEIRVPDGYYVLYSEGGWTPVGKDHKVAADLLVCRTHELGAVAAGSTLVKQEEESTPSGSLLSAIKAYIQQELIDRGRHKKTVDAHRVCLMDFAKASKVTLLSELTRSHCLQYVDAYLRKQGNADHTRANKFDRVRNFLKHEKLELLTSKDRPDFAEEDPLALEPEELAQFWKVCPDDKKLMFTVFLTAGLRMKELQTLRWVDIDFGRGFVKVQPRPEYAWVPKKHHCRDVGISDALLDELRERRLTAKYPLVFHTKSGKKNTHIWEECQAIFAKTKVNMEKAHPHCFRGTFCTTLFRSGWALPDIMRVMGHDPRYPEVTMRYAVAHTNEKLRGKMLGVKFAVAA